MADVLSLEDSSDDRSFSGFSEVDSPAKKGKFKGKSKKGKNPVQSSKLKNKSSDKRGLGQSSDKSLLDISKLTDEDIDTLRSLLGVGSSSEDKTAPASEGCAARSKVNERRPNLRIELDADDISEFDSEHEVLNEDLPLGVNDKFSNVLFGDEETEWDLPKLKAPEKGKAISSSLAELINLSCTAQCDVEHIINKYQVPENCERSSPPSINQEVWKILDRKSHQNDKSIVDIQNLVAIGFSPIIKLAEILKGSISSEAKTLISDTLTIMGQIQYNLSIRRRYLIRPCLKRKYSSLCQVSMPITTKLFGDDISKEVKSCESISSLGKENFSTSYTSYRGYSSGAMSRGRSYRRPGFSQGSTGRYQPYPQRGQTSRPYRGRARGRRGAE